MEYEYSIINMGAMKEKGMIAQEGFLNKMGKEGWELVAIDGGHYIFKRELE